MADRTLAFDTLKCDVEAVERIPPCEKLITDPTVPVAPDPISDCATPLIEPFPPDVPCPAISPASDVRVLDSNFTSASESQLGFNRTASVACSFDFTLGINVRPETGPVVVTSKTPVAGRYPGIRQLENGLPASWTNAESVWVYNVRSNTLARNQIYLVRWNPVDDTFLGQQQGWTLDCCTDLDPPDKCCTEPDAVCLFIEAPGCADLDATTVPVNVGTGLYALCGCWGKIAIGYVCSRPDQGANGYDFVTTGNTPSDIIPDASDCNNEQCLFGDAILISARCDPFELVFQATISNSLPDSGGLCDCAGTVVTFTFRAPIAAETCSCAGGSGNVQIGCNPGSIPFCVEMTFAGLNGDCITCDPDGTTVAVCLFNTVVGNGTLITTWLGSGTVCGFDFYVTWACEYSNNQQIGQSLKIVFPDYPSSGGQYTVSGDSFGDSVDTWTWAIFGITIGDCSFSLAGSFFYVP